MRFTTSYPRHVGIDTPVVNSFRNPPNSAAFHLPVKITRVGQDRDRTLMFRGWSRLCLHAASLSAAEGALAATTAAARAARVEAMKTEAIVAAEKTEAWKRATATSADVAATKERAQREAAELAQQEESKGQVDRQQREHRAKLLVRCCGSWHSLSRVCFMFRGNNITLWSEFEQEDSPRTVLHRTLAHCGYTHETSTFKTPTSVAFHVSLKITRVGRDRDRTLVFRGWSRLCLHAASLSAAEGASAAATAAARAARAEAMETEATAAAEKAEAWKRAAAASADVAASKEEAQRKAAELARREEAMGQVDQQQRKRRTKMMVRRSDAVHSLYEYNSTD